ncbi:FixH family protein [Telmatospirillum siberiense]|uniref:Nitrogen fixation protein FixH n=1 Tax=Telmatospirillum siberiense TaxID=382514 RepID=A0A2N3Q0Q8_9PROT|nr:FixH family protein [Telmatospirillum siberiense]PKU26232.1 hypothetical protein CWS72_03675 [Telmatospirillum siberiense]
MTQSASVSSPMSGRRPGWWYPYIYVGVFLVVLAVNLIFMFSAIHTFSGLSTDQAYDKGLKYNEEIASAKRQQQLGWTVTAEVRATAPTAAVPHGADILVTFKDKDGRPVTGLQGDVSFIRPAQAGHDGSGTMAEQGQGRYLIAAVLPLAGQWDLEVAARRGDVSYRFAQRIYLP